VDVYSVFGVENLRLAKLRYNENVIVLRRRKSVVSIADSIASDCTREKSKWDRRQTAERVTRPVQRTTTTYMVEQGEKEDKGQGRKGGGLSSRVEQHGPQ
jgi:hypothetical protein